MFSYFGSKTNVVDLYPRPKHDLIIEPFAGSARYALKHFEKDVLLIDKYPVIIKIWKWLQQCSPNDILKLPRKLKVGEHLTDIPFDCDEARWLIGFLMCSGAESPRNIVCKMKTEERPNHINYHLNRISASLFKIKHWQIIEGDYTDAPMISATWFVDPPYQIGGQHYKMSSKNINFHELAEWCRSLTGQVIVCESAQANWLPFVPIAKFKGTRKWCTEAIWTNEPTAYDNRQTTIFDSMKDAI